jgi:ATP-dependent protease ClpP protease subunit
MGNNKRRAAGPGKPFFHAEMQPDGTLELMIYEEIGEHFWSDGGVTAKTVKAEMDQAEYSNITVRINSPGGSAADGVAIFNLLRSTKKPIHVFVDGMAASAASIVAMAGDQITMGVGSLLMLHNAWGDCTGYANDMRAMGDVLDTVSAAIGKTYASRTGKTEDEISELMNAETWMTADECLAEGFCTDITEEYPELEISALALARQFKALRKMKHVPKVLKQAPTRNDDLGLDRADSCACDCQNCQDGDCEGCTNAGCDYANCEDCPMQASASASLASWRAKLGLKKPATVAEARDRLESMDKALGASTVEMARARLESIEEVLSQPMGTGGANVGRW